MEIKSSGVWPKNFVEDVSYAHNLILNEGFITGECAFMASERIINLLKKVHVGDESLYEDFMLKYFNTIT